MQLPFVLIALIKAHLITICATTMLAGVAFGAPVQAKAKAGKPASAGQSAILFGSNFSYSVSEPKGWVLDSQAGKSQDLSVVFYKRGQDWQNGDAVVYININSRRPDVSLEREAREPVRSRS